MALAAARTANAKLKLNGKQAVVVGGTAGIGKGVALRLARAGASVTIVGRSPVRGAAVVQAMKDAGAKEAEHHFVSCNCFLLAEVGKCVAALLKQHEAGIDYLVCSQGMATIQGFTPTPEEGLDQKLALHVYSRAAFARGLQPAMAKSKDARCLSVLSAGVHGAYKNYATDPELSLGSYSIKNAADAAGFYNDIIADTYAARFPTSTFLHAAPGFVATSWGTEMPTPLRWMVRAIQAVSGRSMDDCGEYMVRGLTHEEHGGGGFRLLDQYGAATAKVTQLHETAKAAVMASVDAVLDAGRAVAKKGSGL